MNHAQRQAEPPTCLFTDRMLAVENAEYREVSLWHKKDWTGETWATGSYDGLIYDLGYAAAGSYVYENLGEPFCGMCWELAGPCSIHLPRRVQSS